MDDKDNAVVMARRILFFYYTPPDHCDIKGISWSSIWRDIYDKVYG